MAGIAHPGNTDVEVDSEDPETAEGALQVVVDSVPDQRARELQVSVQRCFVQS